MELYTQVIDLIKYYDGNNDFTTLNNEIFVCSLKTYKEQLFEHIYKTSYAIKLKNTKAIYEVLVNISLLCLNHMNNMDEKNSKSIIIETNRLLFQKKNTDYGNSFVDCGLIGVLVRLNDKINRLLTLLSSSNQNSSNMQVNDERIEDTINDLYNYCIIALTYKYVNEVSKNEQVL